MGKLWIALLLTTLLLFFVPILLHKTPVIPKTVKVPEESREGEVEACQVAITVLGLDEPVPLEEYVLGVVSAEMPVTFQEEALKAQAIAARTYALRVTEYGKKPIAADVSAQVYNSKKKRKEKWGKEFLRNEKKVETVVKETAGDTIVFGEEMISAMFFSTSNGQTETARNFSGNDVPYLQSVESPGEEKVAPKYNRETDMTLDEWNKALGTNWNVDMFKSLKLVRNPTGRVQKVMSTDFELQGREMREILGLASTDFDIAYDVTNKIVKVKTTGYGHGVGMSQYGAEAFAGQGWTAEKILQHYYTGTIIKKFTVLDSKCLKTP
ncbi:stage II sporulation protein D [Sporosarcina sp. G11-34]|uniref:stage II sporulation protein D n=1 Tax=Sporosarcina sp. G11-34 TaxID=2849605 RepID=UPI0022A8F8A6|nr:stage II sporulation protein D [Sporosarcina sp. G11-34]MCZ2257546.1 stage II sporulation protein D [Sporosarcina sp. G11-34]